MTTTPVSGANPPPHAPDKATAPKTQATPSQEDAARFSKALDSKAADKPKEPATDSKAPSGRSDDQRMTSDNPSALFRRREAPEQQQRGQGDSRGRDDKGSDKAKERHDEPNPANAMLQQMAPTQAVDDAAPVDAPQPMQQSSLNDVVQQVADRILVGQSSDTGQAEVRITLKDSVLQGTEIRVTENAGAYEITFVADNKDIENFLANRQEQITTSLGEKLDREIKVAVTDRDGTPNQQGDERGRQQGQGQPNDGRSRNQRSVEDERER